MATQKKSANTTQLIGIIAISLLVYFFMKYPLFFIAGLVLILAILVLAYFKVPKFNAWVKGKFQRKGKMSDDELRKWYIEHGFANDSDTAHGRQQDGIKSKPINGTAAAYLCNGCGGALQPVANWPKFMACEKCHKVQQKIN
jgi:hypothetical protein